MAPSRIYEHLRLVLHPAEGFGVYYSVSVAHIVCSDGAFIHRALSALRILAMHRKAAEIFLFAGVKSFSYVHDTPPPFCRFLLIYFYTGVLFSFIRAFILQFNIQKVRNNFHRRN